MPSLLAPAITEIGLITYRDIRTGGAKSKPIPYLPVPAELVGVLIVYGGLSMVSERFDRPAQLFAWGIVIATALNTFTGSATTTSKTPA
jgi:hypothetical protein